MTAAVLLAVWDAVLVTQTLTPVEEQLLRCALDGTVLDLLSPDSDPNTMPTWGPSRQIRAGVLRDLLLGRLSDAPLDPRGVHLRGAVIADRVNLSLVAEGFNIFDYSNYNAFESFKPRLPNVNNKFGQGTSAFNTRRFQLGARVSF